MTINLQQIRARLEAKRDELQRQISGLSEAYPEPVDPAQIDAEDFEEAAVDFLEMQQEQSILVNEQALLTEVQAALKRLDEGTYGTCTNCGRPIPEKRLEVCHLDLVVSTDVDTAQHCHIGRHCPRLARRSR